MFEETDEPLVGKPGISSYAEELRKSDILTRGDVKGITARATNATPPLTGSSGTWAGIARSSWSTESTSSSGRTRTTRGLRPPPTDQVVDCSAAIAHRGDRRSPDPLDRGSLVAQSHSRSRMAQMGLARRREVGQGDEAGDSRIEGNAPTLRNRRARLGHCRTPTSGTLDHAALAAWRVAVPVGDCARPLGGLQPWKLAVLALSFSAGRTPAAPSARPGGLDIPATCGHLGAEASASPGRLLRAVARLHCPVVDHRPTSHRLDDEARVTVAGLGHGTHEKFSPT
jgi:hypothetical protein